MSVQLQNPPPIDRSGASPLYYQLRQWLASRILSGELRPGAQLPGDHELSERLGVSRSVVRQALSELRHDGLIERERGRGTFVASQKTAQGLIGGLRGLADDAALRGQTVESTVLRLAETPADELVAKLLRLDPGEPVVELERLRLLDGEPWVLVVSRLPAKLVPGLAERDFGGSESLYRILREDYSLPIVSSVRRVEAAVTDAREAHLLRIRAGEPLLVLRSIGYTTGGLPLDYFIARHRGDRCTFEVSLPAGSHVGEFA
jgi:GntR family transcriptional regulator, N-acetylglucosamine utilization regulator